MGQLIRCRFLLHMCTFIIQTCMARGLMLDLKALQNVYGFEAESDFIDRIYVKIPNNNSFANSFDPNQD